MGQIAKIFDLISRSAAIKVLYIKRYILLKKKTFLPFLGLLPPQKSQKNGRTYQK